MTAKQKKLFLLTSMMSVFVMAATVLIAGGKLSLSPLSVRGGAEQVEGSITWSTSVSSKSGSGNKVSYLSRTSRGTGIYLYSFGQYNPTGTSMFSSKYNEANDYGIYIKSEAGQSGLMFEFQSITSISITVGTSSQSGTSFEIYTSSTKVSPVKSQTGVTPGQTYSYSTEVANGKFLAIRSTSSAYELQITSVTVNYSCTPGGIPSEKSLSSISVSGQKTAFTVGGTFSFGGTVTANYSDYSSADVTSSATFSGYNMSSIGSQTVTVSYTEDEITETTTYTITVADVPTGVDLTGTYNYKSRKKYVTPDWTDKLWIVFTSATEGYWRSNRSSNSGLVKYNYDCYVYFDYEAVEDGDGYSVSMSMTSYDFRRYRDDTGEEDTATSSGASWFSGYSTIDRPVDNDFTADSAYNNTGVVTSNKGTLTINTFEKRTNPVRYEVYDTLTFTLAS